MNFKNTYIDTSKFGIEDINRIGRKYSEVVLKEDPKAHPNEFWYEYGVETPWNYLAVQPSGYVEIFDSVPSFVIKEITEQDLDNYLEKSGCKAYPTQDFKINLSNMTEAEKGVAKDWLVEVAESRGLNTEYLSEEDYVVNYVWIEPVHFDYERILGYNAGTEDGYYRSKDLPELTLTFSKPAITSWSLPEEKSEKELQLEELVGKLQQQLEEAQQKLNEIR